MFDTTTPDPSRHGEFVDGHGNPKPYTVFGITNAAEIDQLIADSDRQDALEAGRREVEAEIDREYERRMIARDQDAASTALQVTANDLPPAMTFDELCALYGVSTAPTQHFAETWLSCSAISTSMKQAEVLSKAIDAVLNPTK